MWNSKCTDDEMWPFLAAIFGGFISWWGLLLISALDSTMVLFLPLGVDVVVAILAWRSPHFFWMYAFLATAGSLCGAAVTYYIGRRLGEAGLNHFVSSSRLKRVRRRIEEKGAVALAVLDLIPPPFPFTACILAAGALEVSPYLFFVTLGIARLVRFGAESFLAHIYGRQVISWLQSDTVQYVGVALLMAALVGTIVATIVTVRNTRAHRRASRNRQAA
jgi:membrane protein YqaA with SNARE-associated domain